MFIFALAQAQAATADAVLSPYVYVFYAAFIVSFLFTPVMRTVAIYFNIIDQPDRLRKMHDVPVAYLGGVAVFLGWIAGLACSQFLKLHRMEINWWPDHVVIRFSIIVGACVIVLLGLWDDIQRVSPRVKIAGQVFAAGCLLYEGIGAHCTAYLLVPISNMLNIKFGTPMLAPDSWIIYTTSSALVVAIVVGCCNATNLMDGLDGLCGGVTAVIAAGFLFLAVHLGMFGGGLDTNWDALRIVLALALLGAVLGFTPYNFNPASIFMGDTGSMLLGFCCAVMIILMGQGQHPKWFMAAIIVFALPILDTALAFTRRWVNGRPLFSPDKHHFHHQLVARGYSVKQTVLISYSLAIFFALLGCSIIFMRTRYAAAIWLVTFGSIIVAAYKMGMIHEARRVAVPKRIGPNMPVTAPDPAMVLEIADADTAPSPADKVPPGTWQEPIKNIATSS